MAHRFFVEAVQFLKGRVDCEGIFRKSGSVARQRKLRVSALRQNTKYPSLHLHALLLSTPPPSSPPLLLPHPSLFPPPPQATLESGGSLNASSIHDVASLLKQYLRELPSPLLTPPLLPVFEACHELLPPGEDQRRATLLACLLLPTRHLQVSHLLLTPSKKYN